MVDEKMQCLDITNVIKGPVGFMDPECLMTEAKKKRIFQVLIVFLCQGELTWPSIGAWVFF